ncbi:MAG: hypothetical protein LBF41_06195 [Deltaproteobacteria bacterium]|jgi:hypothetical protein|nr:hypothetical protein [Deltaproteobacteria bacterium]
MATTEEKLKALAKEILSLNETDLLKLLPVYHERMKNPKSVPEWEEASVLYFLINGVRIKNIQFPEKTNEINARPKTREPRWTPGDKPLPGSRPRPGHPRPDRDDFPPGAFGRGSDPDGDSPRGGLFDRGPDPPVPPFANPIPGLFLGLGKSRKGRETERPRPKLTLVKKEGAEDD